MHKEKPHVFNFETDWFHIWQKQSHLFFESAHAVLDTFFDKGKEMYMHPEKHMDEINQWLTLLKAQWQSLYDQEKMGEQYQQMMNRLYKEAAEMLVSQWLKGTPPIKNSQALYERWLTCCQAVYLKNMQSVQKDTYTEYMDAFFKYWQSAAPKP